MPIKHELLPKIEDIQKDKKITDFVRTSCQKCIFKKGSPQTGCSYHNRLDKFIEKGVPVYAVDNHCGIGTICNACTQKAPENPVEFVDKILEKQVDFIINYGTIKDIVRTYESIVNQEVLPSRIIVLFNSDEYTTYDLYIALSQPELEREGVKFYIVQPTKSSWNAQIRMCIDKCKSPFFTIFQAGERVPYNLCHTVNYLVNRELAQFISIQSDLKFEGEIASGTVLLRNLFNKLLKAQKEDNIERAFDIEEAYIVMTTPGEKENPELFLRWNN